jgi:DNA repair protein RecN (Recombination protein N)
MLARLSIRDIVLIDQLDLAFGPGFGALTGETGAGKSILLDALGLALGGRAEAGLVRRGAEQAVVSAAFDLPARHAARALLEERGLAADDAVVLRRTLGADGRSRAFVNDQPASVALLRELGALLVEIQGQAEQHGLAQAATHRAVLDAFAGLDADLAALAGLFRAWRDAVTDRDKAAADAASAAAEEDFLRHALGELDALDPKPDEEERIVGERQILMNREKLVEALNGALAELGGTRPVDQALRAARRQIDRLAGKAGTLLDGAAAALDRAAIELAEAIRQLEAAGAKVEADSGRLQALDDRLFALRDLARKHRTTVAALPALRASIADRLGGIVDGAKTRAALEKRVAAARFAYAKAAEAVSAARARAAQKLDKAVTRELPPLKLEKARFAARVDTLPEGEWGAGGRDRVSFEVATLPGAPLGPLGRIASGGELSRLMLALKVVLARAGSAPTLVFDEVDSGIGGATAAAVGERLARLGRDVQVLAVTHSPQVAARADAHYRVEKIAAKGAALARVAALDGEKRREEIARMLSGRDVTDEARRAADALIAGARP